MRRDRLRLFDIVAVLHFNKRKETEGIRNLIDAPILTHPTHPRTPRLPALKRLSAAMILLCYHCQEWLHEEEEERWEK